MIVDDFKSPDASDKVQSLPCNVSTVRARYVGCIQARHALLAQSQYSRAEDFSRVQL